MIVIGVDVHKASLTAVAVDEVGREVGEETTVDGAGLLVWSGTLPGERRPPRCRANTSPAAVALASARTRLGLRGSGPGPLDRTVWLDRLGRRFARGEQTVQTIIARELVGRCRTLTRTIRRDRTRPRDANDGRGAWLAGAARLRPRHGRETAWRDRPDLPLPLRRPVRPPRRRRATRGKQRQTPTPPTRPRRQPPTDTWPWTRSRSPRPACTRPHTPTRTANRPKGRAAAKPSAASNDTSPAPSTPPSNRAAPDIGATWHTPE